ncbi:MAG: hypothetical protein E5X41_13985 [Mesorhizobium sp.]|nr:MAG: hypothetical protein E5X41_13985 [Mesorhizobium sp.]
MDRVLVRLDQRILDRPELRRHIGEEHRLILGVLQFFLNAAQVAAGTFCLIGKGWLDHRTGQQAKA